MLWLLLDAGAKGCTKSYIFHHIDDYSLTATSDQAAERQFTRDKALLREIGVPLIAESGFRAPEGEESYRIDTSRLYLPHIQVTTPELNALRQAQWLWSGSKVQQAVIRATGRLTPAGTDAEEDFAPSFAATLGQTDELLAELSEAARYQRIVAFKYRNADADTVNTRRVRAWLVLMMGRQWYLAGWDFDRGAQRLFRLTRFEPARVSIRKPTRKESELGFRPDDFDPQQLRRFVSDDHSPTTATVWLPEAGADELKIHGRKLDARPGWEKHEFTYTQPADFASRLAAVAEHIIVTENQPELRATVIDILERVLQAHQNPPVTTLPELAPPKRGRRRASDADHISRLLGILAFINEHGEATKHELATRYGVTLSQIEKDLDQLQYCGLPERSFIGEQFDVEELGDTVRMHRTEALSGQLRLTTPEAISLLAGLQSIQTVPGIETGLAEAAESMRQKILHNLKQSGFEQPENTVGNAIDVDLGLGQDADTAAELHEAIQNRQLVELTYFAASSQQATTRTVEPLRLSYANHFTYLQAWCHRARGLRDFRLDRIGELTLLPEQFHPRIDAEDLPAVEAGIPLSEDEGITVTLWVSHSMRDVLTDYAPLRQATLEDGSVVAQLRFRSLATVWELCTTYPGSVIVVADDDGAEHVHHFIQHAERGIQRLKSHHTAPDL